MITREFRPSTFAEVVGNDISVRLLKAIAKHPEDAPTTIILCGGYGCGKTTCSRVFAKALNCEHFRDDVCGKCKCCLQDIQSTPYYREYDSSVVGNIDSIRELKESFSFSVKGHYRVIVLDESHLINKQSQSALLKVFEETPRGVFFLLPTTDPDKLLPTIRSRSLELTFTTQPKDSVVDNLRRISLQKGVELSDSTLDHIYIHSHGHMRNAHMLLDKCLLLGEEDFMRSFNDIDRVLLNFTLSIYQKNQQNCFKCIDSLLSVPVSELYYEFQNFLLKLLRVYSGIDSEPRYKKLVTMLGDKTVQFVRFCSQDWVMKSFENDIQLQTSLLAIYQLLAKPR